MLPSYLVVSPYTSFFVQTSNVILSVRRPFPLLQTHLHRNSPTHTYSILPQSSSPLLQSHCRIRMSHTALALTSIPIIQSFTCLSRFILASVDPEHSKFILHLHRTSSACAHDQSFDVSLAPSDHTIASSVSSLLSPVLSAHLRLCCHVRILGSLLSLCSCLSHIFPS